MSDELTQEQIERGARLFSILVAARERLNSESGVPKTQSAVNIRASRFIIQITRDDDALRAHLTGILQSLADLPIDFVVKVKAKKKT